MAGGMNWAPSPRTGPAENWVTPRARRRPWLRVLPWVLLLICGGAAAWTARETATGRQLTGEWWAAASARVSPVLGSAGGTVAFCGTGHWDAGTFTCRPSAARMPSGHESGTVVVYAHPLNAAIGHTQLTWLLSKIDAQDEASAVCVTTSHNSALSDRVRWVLSDLLATCGLPAATLQRGVYEVTVLIQDRITGRGRVTVY